jgi:co-chaperonin GroES (HSP10)
MSSKIKNVQNSSDEMTESNQDEQIRINKNSTLREARVIRRINPLGYRVVVKIRKDSNMTDTGLYLPEGAKQNMQDSVVAEVIEVASAVDDDTHEEANVSGIPLGAVVLIPKESGVKVPWDEELRIVETKHILAIIEEVRLT